MNAKLLLNLTLAFAVVFAGLLFPFGYINLGLKSEAWYAPWPLTLLIGACGAAIGIGLRKTDRHAGTITLGFMALGYFVGCVWWLGRLADSEVWIGRGVAWYAVASVALYGAVVAPIVKTAKTFHIWAKT